MGNVETVMLDEGSAIEDAELKLGEQQVGMCSRKRASIIVITEEGSGICRYYPFPHQAIADTLTASWWCSGLTFKCKDGFILEEIPDKAIGLNRRPFNTIRVAAQKLLDRSIHGKVFVELPEDGQARVQAIMLDETLGRESFHFVSDSVAYVSLESIPNLSVCAKDLPPKCQSTLSRQYFQNVCYDASSREFRGVIMWYPGSVMRFPRVDWPVHHSEYYFQFDEQFQHIIGGSVAHYAADGRSLILEFGSAELPSSPSSTPSCQKLSSFKNTLRYVRWQHGYSDELDESMMPLVKRPFQPLEGFIFVQSLGLGVKSFHFPQNGCPYVSFEDGYCSGPNWILDDGAFLPKRKIFQNATYDEIGRRFQGTIEWDQSTFIGARRSVYAMTFNEDLTAIIGGGIEHFGLDDQVVPFSTEEFASCADRTLVESFGNTLYYTRWVA